MKKLALAVLVIAILMLMMVSHARGNSSPVAQAAAQPAVISAVQHLTPQQLPVGSVPVTDAQPAVYYKDDAVRMTAEGVAVAKYQRLDAKSPTRTRSMSRAHVQIVARARSAPIA